jgi:AcrR family transcriptional regulator
MAEPGKPLSRRYDAAGRQASARRTRGAILDAAVRLFTERGYAGATMADIAGAAGVALDTVYAVVGPKATLFRLLIETAISGTEEPVPVEERAFVQAIHAETDARRKLEIYAEAVRTIQGRMAPLLHVLRGAAPAEPELATVWHEITERRARNMRLFVAEVAGSGALREDLSLDEAADIVWATNSSELYILLVHERGWAPDRYERWLADAWRRLLLRDHS